MRYIVPVKLLAAVMVDAENESEVGDKAAEVAKKFSEEGVKKCMFDFMIALSKEVQADVILIPSVVFPEKEKEHVELINSFVQDYVRRCTEGFSSDSDEEASVASSESESVSVSDSSEQEVVCEQEGN